MKYKFYVQFESDVASNTYTEITDYIKAKSIVIKKSLHSTKFKSVQDSLTAKTHYDETINAKFNQTTTYMKAYVVSDEGTTNTYGCSEGIYGYNTLDEYGYSVEGRVFTGAIYPNTKEKHDGTDTQGVSFEIVDNSYLLEKNNIKISYESYQVFNAGDKAHSIIHQLLYASGVSDVYISSLLSIHEVIDYVELEKDETTYRKLINDILYEFHYVSYFDEDGIFHIYDFKHVSISPTAVITDNEILSKGVNRDRNILDINGYKVKYSNYYTKDNALLYRQDLGDGLLLPVGAIYPFKASSATVYQEYSNKWLGDKTTLIGASNFDLQVTKDDDIEITTQNYEPTKAQVVFTNISSESKYLRQFDIRGDAIYTTEGNEITVPVVTTKVKEMSVKYLHNKAQAKELGDTLYNNLIKYGKYFYSFSSIHEYTLGQEVNIDTKYSVNAVIYDYKFNKYTEKYDYKLMGLGTHVTQDNVGYETEQSSNTDLVSSLKLLSSSNVFSYSKRTGAVNDSILVTAVLKNLIKTDIIWSSLGVDLEEDSQDPYGLSRLAMSNTLTGENAVVTATMISNDITYTDTIVLDKVYTDVDIPEYLGMYNVIPNKTIDNRYIIIGDWLLWTENSITTDNYLFGHVYEYNGIDWIESTDSVKLSVIIPDALSLARDSGEVVYASTIYTESLVAQNILVSGTLSNTPHTDPLNKKGFKIDGTTGLIEATEAHFVDCAVSGSFTSDEFRTQREEVGDEYSPQTVAKTLWNERDIYNNIVSESECLQLITSSWWDTFDPQTGLRQETSYPLIVKKNNDYVTFETIATPISEEIYANPLVAGLITVYEFTVPSTYGDTVRLKFTSTLSGWNNRQSIYEYPYNDENLIDDTSSETFNFNMILTAGQTYRIIGNSGALWGQRTMTIIDFKYVSNDLINGIAVCELDYKLVPKIAKSISVYHDYSITTSNGFNSNNHLTRCSGTTFIDELLASAIIPVSADVIGTLILDGIEYKINTIKKSGQDIIFTSEQDDIIICKFKDGTSTGTYTSLASSLISIVAQSGGVKVKSVIPKGDNLYDIGQQGDGNILSSWISVVGDSIVGDRVRGTDGLIYKCYEASGSGSAIAQPIKGDSWDGYWEKDSDQSHTKIRFKNGYFAGAVEANSLTLPRPSSVEINSYEGRYIILPNGIIIQWGAEYVDSNGSENHHFPISFTTGSLISITCGAQWNNEDGWAVGDVYITDESHYQIQNVNNSGRTIYWIAIAY